MCCLGLHFSISTKKVDDRAGAHHLVISDLFSSLSLFAGIFTGTDPAQEIAVEVPATTVSVVCVAWTSHACWAAMITLSLCLPILPLQAGAAIRAAIQRLCWAAGRPGRPVGCLAGGAAGGIHPQASAQGLAGRAVTGAFLAHAPLTGFPAKPCDFVPDALSY